MTHDDENLSHDEMTRLLRRLRPADLVRLTAIAGTWVRNCPRREALDLLNEAFARVLSGQRAWPAKLPVFAFLPQVMRSIASQWRNEDMREPLLDDDPEVAEHAGTPIDLDLKDLIGRMRTALHDDPMAAQVLEQQLLQNGRDKARKILGISHTEYQTARRRMIRTLRRQFYPSWKS